MIFLKASFFRICLILLIFTSVVFAQQKDIPIKLIDTSQLKAVKERNKQGLFDAIGEIAFLNEDILLEAASVVDGKFKRYALAYTAPNVQGINLYFNDLQLPIGSKFILKGAYRNQEIDILQNKTPNTSKYATGFIYGDYIELTLEIPLEKVDEAKVLLEGAGITQSNILPKDIRKDFGDAADCNINIQCAEGDLWQKSGRSVVRIIVRNENLVGFCTGVLVNNTNEDFTPYILTAQHCGLNEFTGDLIEQSNFDQWVFSFNYEVDACTGVTSPNSIPVNVLVGADIIAHSDDEGGESGSDFLLLRLKNPIPASFDPVFAGWSNIEIDAPSGVAIHHPQGDVKKISTYNTPLESSQFSSESNIRNTHWRVVWTQTANGFGITEGGSSGAPLFNNAGQVVGNLTGGLASCERLDGFDLFGKVSYHWRSNGNADTRQLANWLDPSDLDVTAWRSIDANGNLVTSNDDDIEIKSLEIFPNPTNTNLWIILPSKMNISPINLTIFDRAGKQIKQEAITTFAEQYKVDVSYLSKGLYYITLSNNDYIYRNKIVIY